MTHYDSGAQSGLLIKYCPQKVVGVDMTFHQQVSVTLADGGSGLASSLEVIGLVDYLHLAEVQVYLVSQPFNFALVADQQRVSNVPRLGLFGRFQYALFMGYRYRYPLSGVIGNRL